MVVLFGGSLEGGRERRNVVLVPSESKAEPGVEVRATTVPGLSPVKGDTMHSFVKPHRFRKYEPMIPREVPPSTGSPPSFFERSAPQAARSVGSHLWVRTSIRFIPDASDVSMEQGNVAFLASDSTEAKTNNV